jgi:hypothetical protein
MRNLHLLDSYRMTGPDIISLFGTIGDHTCGAFVVPSPVDKRPLKVIASSAYGWDHVSVSRVNRCPNWPEMDYVKRLFFEKHEVAMQLHVAEKDHINCHPFCLHLWRPWAVDGILLPPSFLVGPRTNNA